MDIPPQVPPPAELVPAGFWIRAGAYMIDGMLVMLGQVLLMGFLVLVGIPRIAAQLGSSLLGIAYFVWMPAANSGQTVGKMAAGIAIMRTDGTPLTYLRCLGRWGGYMLSSITLGLGFLIAAFTDRKRALHDYICDTRVVFVAEVGGLRRTLVILAAFIPVLFGIAAALAIPKFLQLAAVSSEPGARGNLAVLRQWADSYKNDNDGKYPAQLDQDLASKYGAEAPSQRKVPSLRLKDHGQSSEVVTYDGSVCSGTAVDPTKIQDTGKWGYVSDPAASCYGSVFVDCAHVDSKKRQWVSY
jgi:uncharacterized RDD family membrane protein YckC